MRFAAISKMTKNLRHLTDHNEIGLGSYLDRLVTLFISYADTLEEKASFLYKSSNSGKRDFLLYRVQNCQFLPLNSNQSG